MPSGNSVAGGQTATFKLPMGSNYHNAYLTYSGVTLAQMTEIRVVVNGKILQRYSATMRDAMNQFDGRDAAAEILTIPFGRYNLKLKQTEDATSLNTASENLQTGASITSINIEIDIDAAALTPILKLHAEISPKLKGGAGNVLHVLKRTIALPSAGEHQIGDIQRGTATTMLLNRIFFANDAGDISNIKIMANNVDIHNRTKALNELMQNNGVRIPQALFHVVDRTENGTGGDLINLMDLDDFRFYLECSASMNVVTTAEYIGRLGD